MRENTLIRWVLLDINVWEMNTFVRGFKPVDYVIIYSQTEDKKLSYFIPE